MQKDYYKILNVDKSLSPEEIKKQCRQTLASLHPDKGGDEDVFVEYNEAYFCLTNHEQKAYYDQYGIPQPINHVITLVIQRLQQAINEIITIPYSTHQNPIQRTKDNLNNDKNLLQLQKTQIDNKKQNINKMLDKMIENKNHELLISSTKNMIAEIDNILQHIENNQKNIDEMLDFLNTQKAEQTLCLVSNTNNETLIQ